MDHEGVVRQKLTERYLLNELEPKVREEFEEHFFECTDCAFDVRAGATFVEHSKIALAESPVQSRVPAVSPVRRPWPSWMRPAFAGPAFFLLLAVILYQNLVTYPKLQEASKHPQVLPWASVNVGTWGAGGPVVATSAGSGFLLFVRIPPDDGYSRYTADLYSPEGKLEWTLTIPANSSQDQWPIQVPGQPGWKTGTYTLAVHGTTSSGESKDVGRTSFQLQIQQ